MNFNRLFYPERIAVIGSMTPGKLGAILVDQILAYGYEGAVAAVNPKGEGRLGVPGFASLREIGQVVDLAVIASPAATVAGVLEECGQAGVGAAVIITSGFSEAGNKSGEEELVQVARKYNLRFAGPNCAGIANTAHRLSPSLEVQPPAGSVALVSQSGALGGVVLGWAREQGLGISKFVSYGNGADLEVVDFLRYLTTDEETKVVALYIESILDGRQFMDALSACAQVKPVIVIKAGRTSAGRRATASHTGSMAGSDAVYQAALRQCGAIRVETVEELLDLCSGFTSLPPVKGKKLLILTNSGGPGVLSADRAEELGLEVAEPSPQAQARLRAFLPKHCSLNNPIDLTVEGTEAGYRETLMAAMGEYDAVLAMSIFPAYLETEGIARGVVEAVEKFQTDRPDRPIPAAACFLPQQIAEKGIAYLKQHGIPNFSSGERAVFTLAAMAEDWCTRGRLRTAGSAGWRARERSITPGRLPAGQGPMLEPEAMTWLGENGFPVPPFRWITTQQEAVQAAEALGYPVVMKVVSPQILHKSDLGGVVLDIRDAAAARAAFDRIKTAAEGKDFRGVVVYPLIRGGREVLFGLSRDPQFGPVVAFGRGGIDTEVYRDISLRAAPVNPAEAREMIEEAAWFRVLQGGRGRPPADLDCLIDLLVDFSWLPFRYLEIEEVDLNPVFAFSRGAVVGDVRVILKRED